MKALIMAGGRGTRLTSVTKDEIPKPMVRIAGKPILEWQIEQMKENYVNDIMLVIGYLGDVVEGYFGDGSDFGVNIHYFREKEPLGSAGALAFMEEWLDGEAFLLVYGDILFHIDMKRMMEFHTEKGADITLLSHPNDHPFDSDLVCKDADGRVCSFLKKNECRDFWFDNCVNAGIYIANATVCDWIKKGNKADLAHDVLIPAVKDGRWIYAYESTEFVKDIGTPERLEEAERAVKSGLFVTKDLRYKQKAIFLDRDGTINKYRGLVFREDDLELEDNAAEGIRKINQSGFLAIVVSNQPSVARGLCSIEDVEQNHLKLKTLLGRQGAYLDAIYFCPHHPDKGYPEENPIYKVDCGCRKPKTGMIQAAVDKFNIDIESSWMIGDTTTDIKTGHNAHMKTVLLKTGEAGNDEKFEVEPGMVCEDLLDAVNKILLKG